MSEAQRELLQGHADECAGCRRELADLADVRDAMQADVLRPPSWRASNTRVAIAAAATVIAVTGGALLLRIKPPSIDVPGSASGPATMTQPSITGDGSAATPAPLRRIDPVSRQETKLSSQREATTDSEPALIEMALVSGLVRGGNEANVLGIPTGVPGARLRLPLSQSSYPRYAVSLETPDGRELWRKSGLRSHPAPGPGREVRIELAARLLKGGDYILKLRGTTTEGSDVDVDEFVLQVQTGELRR